MHPFFAPLSRYEAALLLTTLSVGEQRAAQLLERMAEPSRSRLLQLCQALLAMPPETRRPLMASQFKGILAREGRAQLDLIDPTWLLHALRGESPRMVGALLMGLQPSTMNALLGRLPATIRRHLPPKQQLQSIDGTLLIDLHIALAARFAPMPEPPSSNARSFDDLLFLEREELFRVVRDLGFTELGQAFAAVEKVALLELCRRLEKSQAHELLRAVKSASNVDQPDAQTARHFLSKIVVNFDDVEEFLQKSGLWRLARASFRNDPAWLAAFCQRLPRQAGSQFNELCNRAQETLSDSADDVRLRLRDAILLRVVQLSRLGQMGSMWQQAQVVFHDQAGCEALLAAGEAAAAPDPAP